MSESEIFKSLQTLFLESYELSTDDILCKFNDYLKMDVIEEYDRRIAVLRKQIKKLAFFDKKDKKWIYRDW